MAKNAQKDAEDSEKVSIAVKEQAEDLAASLDVKIKMPLDDLREEFAQIEQLRLQIQEQLDEVNKNFEVMEKMDLAAKTREVSEKAQAAKDVAEEAKKIADEIT